MKRKLTKWLMVPLFLMVCLEGVAQNSLILKTQDLPRKNSLIRTWNTDYSIGYSDYGGGQGYFFLENIANRYMYVAPLRGDVMVNDFCVYNDSVYFCGTNTSTNVGVVGHFDINSVFYGTGWIDYGEISYLTMSTSKVLRFTRMDVFEYAGHVHWAMVGELEIPGHPITTTLCDVYNIGIGGWIVNLYDGMTSLGDMVYTDIAATDEWVVATSKKRSSNEYMVSVYRVVSPFLSTPLNGMNKFLLYGDSPLDDILIEDIGEDSFVLAHHYDSLSIAGTEFSVIIVDGANQTIVPQYYWQVPHNIGVSALSGKMFDLHYDSGSQRLLLLHDAGCSYYTGVESVVFELDLFNAVSGFVKCSYIHGISMNGMDVMTNGNFQTIGIDVADSLAISHEWNLSGYECRTVIELPSTIFPLTSGMTFFQEITASFPRVVQTSIPIVVKVEPDTYCEY